MTKKFTFTLIMLGLFLFVQSQESGLVFLSADQGQNWQKADTGFPEDAMINDFVQLGTTLYAATQNYGIFRSDDRGKNWRPANFGLRPDQKVDVLANSTTTLFAGTFDKGVFVSIDGGLTWFPANKGLTSPTIRSLDVKGNVVYASTNDGLFVSENSGREWRLLTDALQVNKVVFMQNALIAATHKGVLYSEDKGANWKWIYDQDAIRNISVHDSELYIMDYGTETWKSANFGESWLRVFAFDNNFTSTILSLGHQIIASRLSGLFISHNHGLTWEKINTPFPLFKKLIWLDGSTLIAIAGTYGC